MKTVIKLAKAVALLLLCLLLFSSPKIKAQEGQSTEVLSNTIDQLVSQMSPEERVGQLFMVTFPGSDFSEDSAATKLIRDLHIGGVALRASNGNYQNDLRAVESLVTLTNGLQDLTNQVRLENETPFVPLFIAVDLVPTTSPYADGLPQRGFTPLPSAMSLGATWDTKNAEKVGSIVGQELNAVGINMLLGPILDIVDSPYSEVQHHLTNHTFGDHPYWVGQMGRSFAGGVAEGSEGRVATIARHFPGMGSSDRTPDDEIATIQKSLEELQTQDMQPFFAVTDISSVITGTVDGLMTTNLRYRALQGNVRQTTRPISLDAQSLPSLISQPELQAWYQTRGIVVSGELGTVALRRFYEQQFESGTFPARTVAREAFNAGNDLLFLADFALTDNWTEQLANIDETLTFFVEQYNNDPVFATKVEASLRRLLALKLRLYDNQFEIDQILVPDPNTLTPSPLNKGENVQSVANIAQEAATLLYPQPDELTSVLPAPPLSDEKIVIVTDAKPVRDCAVCREIPVIGANTFEESLLRRYGPDSSGQLAPEQITSITFTELNRLLNSQDQLSTPAPSELESIINDADWLIFLVQNKSLEPVLLNTSNALTLFLQNTHSLVRSQKLIVLSFGSPHYLDSTELSKITAYYAFYTANPLFVDAASLLLFQEYSASGASPVSISALDYDTVEQLSPSSSQRVELCDDTVVNLSESTCSILPATWDLRDNREIALRTSVILDSNNNPVPDGTLIHFVLHYPEDNVEQPRQTVQTKNGIARTNIVLGREGTLVISAQADSPESFDSTSVQITLQGSNPLEIATATTEPTSTPTLIPTPTATSTPTLTPTPSPTIKMVTPTVTITPSPTITPLPPTRFNQQNEGFGWWTLWGSLGSLFIVCVIGLITSPKRPIKLIRRTLLILLYGLIGYLFYTFIYAFRLLPSDFTGWSAIVCTLIVGLIGLIRSQTE